MVVRTLSLRDVFEERRDEAPFLIFIAFLVSFSVARIYELYGIRGPSLKFGESGAYTGHHLYYGIALLIIATWIAINYEDRDFTSATSILYGAGLGIFFDEIGLIVTEFEDYWTGVTYTYIVIITLVLLNLIFFRDFWRSFGSQIRDFAEKRGLKEGPLNLMGLVSFLNQLERNYPRTKEIIRWFIGLILIVTALLVLEFPELINYYISTAFFLTGIANIVRAFK